MSSENFPLKHSNPVLWATVFWPIMGAYSGMRPLLAGVQALAPGFARSIAQKPVGGIWKSRARRLFNPQLRTAQREHPIYLDTSWSLERQIHQQVVRTRPSAVVLDSVDDQFYLLAEKRASWPKTRLVGICHTPPAYWRLRSAQFIERLKSLDVLVNMSTSARPFWVSLLGDERVVTIPHGVDTDFFSPDETERKPSADDGRLRVVCVGRTLRDFDTLADVVTMVEQLDLPIWVDMVLPMERRNTDACYRIAMSSRVRWHSRLSDESLRQLYRQADLALLILTDATANNSLLEAMSCGLPAIVTDVGGVRDYARETFCDFVRPRDAAQATEILQSYVGQIDKLKHRGIAAREHAKSQFPWKKIAGDYLTLLQRVIMTP